MFQLKSPNGLDGKVKNWFSRWWLWHLFWISNCQDFWLFFIYMYNLTRCYIVRFNLICLVICKMSKTDFQNGSCGGHLGFLIDTILAHFDPEVVLLLQSKFQLKSTKSLGRDVENWFSRWWLWRSSWIFDWLSFSYLCLLGTPMLLIKFLLN